MRTLHDRVSFNRFPADKEYLCELLNQAADWDDEISTFLHLEPAVYDRIFFVMSDKELRTIAKRRGDPGLESSFTQNDALISYRGHCVILHVPAIARKLAHVELRPGDPEGKVLFTIHLFSCLFHELGHACHTTRWLVERMWAPEKTPPMTAEEAEKAADQYEAKIMGRFGGFLEYSGLTWPKIAERLLFWDKLGPVIMRERGNVR